MKRTLFASFAVAVLAASSAFAADLPAPAAPVYYKAPPPPAPTWTGCYVNAGAGYGLWNQDAYTETFPGLVATSNTTTFGGRGWYGLAGAGCDYQVAKSWVVGAFGDYDFMSLQGQYMDPLPGFIGTERESGAWNVGGRVGYLVTPAVLSFVSAGYSQTRFDQINFGPLVPGGGAPGVNMGATTYGGWFLGGGFETSLAGIFDLPLPPGLFIRTEYRYSSYSAKDNQVVFNTTGATFDANHVLPYVQTIGTSLVWKFNWAAPLAARY